MRRVLLGRDAERAQLLRVLEPPAAGGGGSCWVSGPSGIGKTALLGVVAQQAEACGSPVLWGRCDPGADDIPFWPWLDVLHSRATGPAGERLAAELGGAGPALVRAMPDLQELLPDVVAAAAPSRFAVSAGVRSWLSRVGSPSRALLLLDDLQDADLDSLQLLLSVVRDLGRLPVVVVGAFQPPARPDAAELLSRSAREGDHVVLGPLSEGAVLELGARAGEQRLSPAQLRHVVEVSEGNPFLALELVSWLRAHPDDDRPLPPGLVTLAARRLEVLAPDVRALLEGLAVLGRAAPVALLARVVGRPTSVVAGALDAAVREDVLRETSPGVVAFAHRLHLDAVLAGLAPTARARLHRAVAEVLESTEPDADPATVASHWLGSAPLEPERAVRAALAAARSALDRAAPAVAAEQLERALALLPGVVPTADRGTMPTAAAVRLQLARARWAAGDLAGADAAAWAAAGSTGDVSVRAEAALMVGGRIVVEGVPDQRHVALLDDVLDELDPRTAPGLRARALARRGQLECLRSDPAVVDREAVPRCRDALRLSEQARDPAAEAVALFMLHFVLDDPRRLEQRLPLSDRFVAVSTALDDPEWQAHALLFRAVDLLAAGHLPQAREVLDLHAPVVHRLQHPLYTAAGQTLRSSLALAEGRLDDAERWAHAALAEIAAFPHPQFRLLALSHLVEASRARGRTEQCTEAVGALADETGHPLALALQALCAADQGELGCADDLLRRLALDDFAALPAWTATGMAALLTDVAVAVGAVQLGGPLEHRLTGTESLLITGGRPTVAPRGLGGRALAKLARLRGDVDAAVALGRRAVADHDRLPGPLWAAGTMTELAAALRERGRTEDHRDAAQLDRRSARLLADVVPARVPLPAGGGVVTMHRQGPDWDVVLGGRSVRARDSSGLQHLARLVAEPGREFHVLELVAAAPAAGGCSSEPAATGRRDDGLGPVLDHDAVRSYRRRLLELGQALEDADARCDVERAAQARAERQFLLDELAAATGLHGRPRPTGSRVERARSSATHALRRAIARLADADEALGTHLARAVRTGTFTSYRP